MHTRPRGHPAALGFAVTVAVAAGCILANPAFDQGETAATQDTGASGETTTAESTLTTSATSDGGSTSTSASTTATSSDSSTPSASAGGETSGGALCPECAAEEQACDANQACGVVRGIAADCGGDPVCVNEMACDALRQAQAAEGLTLWGALTRCAELECPSVDPTICAVERAACFANPACVDMSTCVSSQCSCLPGAEIPACWNACGAENPDGKDDWTAWLMCVEQRGGGG